MTVIPDPREDFILDLAVGCILVREGDGQQVPEVDCQQDQEVDFLRGRVVVYQLDLGVDYLQDQEVDFLRGRVEDYQLGPEVDYRPDQEEGFIQLLVQNHIVATNLLAKNF